MRQTANYQLSQWDAEDRILREDFNRDNEKIDVAIAAVKERSIWRQICEVVTQEDAQEIVLDLEGFDWDQWIAVDVEVEAFTREDRTGVLVCADSTDLFQAMGNVPGSYTHYLGHVILLPLGDKRRAINGYVTNGFSSANLFCSSARFSSARYHPFVLSGLGGAEILAGTKVTVWGVKK